MPISTASCPPDIKPKSSRRFLHFSSAFSNIPSLPSISPSTTTAPYIPPIPPLPPLPSLGEVYTSRPELRRYPSASSLGSGATIVRRPSDARRDMIPNIVGAKALSHRSLSASAAAALSRSLTGRFRDETTRPDDTGRMKETGNIQISPDIPPRPPRPSQSTKEQQRYLQPTRSSDGSYTSTTNSTTPSTTSSDGGVPPKTPRTPPAPVPPKSAMRKSSLPDLYSAHPFLSAPRGHVAHPSIDSLSSGTSVNAMTGRREKEVYRRMTLKPAPRAQSAQTFSMRVPPFHAISLGMNWTPNVATPGAGLGEQTILVKLHFAYSLAADHNTSPVTLPWSVLHEQEGFLVEFINQQMRSARLLSETMDAKQRISGRRKDDYAGSADSDYDDKDEENLASGDSHLDINRDSEDDYTTLLRDEYLKSLWTDTPIQPDLSQGMPPMPITHAYSTPPKHRARTRNQYVQKLPTTRQVTMPASLLPPETDHLAGGAAELRVLLLRDAEPYHLLAHRLLTGSWAIFAPGARRKVEDELRYLGMDDLVNEVKRQKSLVGRGGVGYI